MPRTTTPSAASSVVVSNSTIIAQLSDEIRRALRSFHKHSKTCQPCRNPVGAYQEGRDLCRTGRDLSVAITKLLYKKAEHVPNGAFEVEYKHGWTAVDGLIRIICHYNQGEYSTQIVDLKRQQLYLANQQPHYPEEDDRYRHHHHQPRHNSHSSRHHPRIEPAYSTPMLIQEGSEVTLRGSQYEEDLRRRHRMRSASAASNMAVYGDPHVSYLDAPTMRPQAENVSPASSSRSVHFDSHVHVREFHP